MEIPFSPYAITPIAAVLGFALIFYSHFLPRPIPGIPHNAKAVRRLLGDLPDILAHISKTDTLFPWLAEQTIIHDSPIVQIFGRPFQKPWVIISDFRESQDIMLRRTKQFDRSDFLGDVFVGLVPDMHISRKSHEEAFKNNRALLKDLMTPRFLHDVAAPQVYANVQKLVELWQLKAKLAKEHAFEASRDIYNGALDFIFATTFGLDVRQSTTGAQIDLLIDTKSIPDVTEESKPVDFPIAARPPVFEAILTLTESLETSVKSPSPKLHHWFLRQLPYMRRARSVKEDFITKELDKAVQTFESGKNAHSALEDILHRELLAAKKENRVPNYKSRAIYDELYGFLIGGHDTISTSFEWGLKNLADIPGPQETLRSHLHESFRAAVTEKRSPTIDEITKTSVPYLDATIEEILRTARVFPGAIRNATVDTTILGHRIPKGTDVFFLNNGPDYLTPGFNIQDSLRTQSALEAKNQTGSWDPEDMAVFKPERWLVTTEEGNTAFDSMAGPNLSFGLGPRGCFGRRLAYLELRIILVMLIWNFEFLKCPDDLSSYAAIDKLSRQPKSCFVRVKSVSF